MTPELIALLLAAVAGAALAMLFDRRAVGSLLAGEALLLGIATCSGVLFALSLVGIRWSRTSFGVAIAVVIALVWAAALRTRRNRAAATPALPPRHPAVFALYLLAIVLVAGYATFATVAPTWEFDFIGDWGLKARSFFIAGGFDWTFLEHPFHYDIHADYPPLLPLAFDVFAVLRGAWNDTTTGLISVAYAVALLLVVQRVALEETDSAMTAAFITAAMVPFACSPWIGLAEGPFIAYATTGLLLIRRGSVASGAVMLGLAASTKNEGLTLIVAAALALLFARRPREIARLWPAVAIPLPWLILRRLHGLHTDITTGDVLSRVLAHLRDPKPLFEAIAQHGAGKPILWIALAAGILVALGALVRRERFTLVALILQFLFYIGAYLATPHDVDWHVHWSWERLISHLSPMLTYVVLVSLIGDRASSFDLRSSKVEIRRSAP